ncbi:MAG: hypothetical protein RLZ72_855 [Actinomycetota bacterium]
MFDVAAQPRLNIHRGHDEITDEHDCVDGNRVDIDRLSRAHDGGAGCHDLVGQTADRTAATDDGNAGQRNRRPNPQHRP